MSFSGPVAQRLERRTHNPPVAGSSPAGSTSFFADNHYASRFTCQGASLTVLRGLRLTSHVPDSDGVLWLIGELPNDLLKTTGGMDHLFCYRTI